MYSYRPIYRQELEQRKKDLVAKRKQEGLKGCPSCIWGTAEDDGKVVCMFPRCFKGCMLGGESR